MAARAEASAFWAAAADCMAAAVVAAERGDTGRAADLAAQAAGYTGRAKTLSGRAQPESMLDLPPLPVEPAARRRAIAVRGR